MAQELKSINLVAPAFKGLNTEDAILAQDPSFAEVANNAVIDRRGRLATRKGIANLSTTITALDGEPVTGIHVFRDSDGNTDTFSVGNNKILRGQAVLVDYTPVAYTITSDDWRMVNFNDSLYFFQRGYEPLVYSHSTSLVEPMSTVAGAAGVTSAMYGNEVIGAYGRLWTADFTGDKSTIYWSDLLQGHVWSGGSSGSIDVSEAWPQGFDQIVALAAHNDFLIVLGTQSVLVYAGAEDPTTMTLSDTITGVGCVSRHTVQSTGSDLVFLSHSGLRSLGRTIQEKSASIGKLSSSVTSDIIAVIDNETEEFDSAYYPEQKFYLILFRNQCKIYCFDTRGALENGAWRATYWPDSPIKALYAGDRISGDMLIGYAGGIGKYDGYTDDGSAYRLKYRSPELSLGDTAQLKFIKKIRPTLVGSTGQPIVLRWGYDFDSSSGSASFTPAASGVSEFGIGEFNIGEFSSGQLAIRKSINANGSGSTLSVTLESDVNGNELSIQEINMLLLTGRSL
jgi:hypothetical protein